MTQQTRQFTINILIALITTLLAIGLIEGGTRLIGISPQPERFQLSTLLGWEWTPEYDQLEDYKGTQFQMTVNQQGLRAPTTDHNYAIPKPPNTFRVIALGDSIVASPGVPWDETFAVQLENELQQDFTTHRVEVINAGTDDYSTEQERIWLQERGLAFQPDLVILHVYLNDSRSFGIPSLRTAQITNFMAQHSAVYALVRTLQVASMVNQEDFRFRYIPALEEGDWREDTAVLTSLIQSADRDWGLAWYEQAQRTIEENVLQIQQLTTAQDIPLLIVLFPVTVQLYAEVDTPLGLTAPQQEFALFAAQHDLPLLDLLPVLQAIPNNDLFFDQVHIKPVGHAPVAQAIANALRENQLLPPDK
ncbi:MAG: SGNH/GDSL hydrolase family protein [Ardenticatenaceae bacterium]|nr:SGNH/GDSL hydrolase family protein [Ardenticatenaceae bacterium]